MDKKDVAKSLNTLLEYLYDSRNGYQECSESVERQDLQNLLQNLAKRRETMIQELKGEILAVGDEPIDSGSILAAAHRTFIDLKSLVTGGDAEAIINEIKRGENTTIDKYQSAIEQNLPPHITQVLQNQLLEIRNNLTLIDQVAGV